MHERAAENLAFIRETMARASSFTAVPGWGGVGMGTSALVAAWFAQQARAVSSDAWLRVWLIELCVGAAVAIGAMVLKARRSGVPLLSGVGRKFALSFTPPMLAGALLTVALARWELAYALPGVWILLYGVAVTAAGALSVRAVPVMGSLFIAGGGVVLFLPFAWGDAAMALSFGVLHIGFGIVIARRHGG